MRIENGALVIASSDRLFAEATAAWLKEHAWHPLVATDGVHVLATVGRREPAAVLILGALERLSADAVAREINRRWPSVIVVAFGVDAPAAAVSLTAAADGPDVLEALRHPPSGSSATGGAEPPERVPELTRLTPRERLILRLLVEGLSMHDIAQRLAISPHTVRTHAQNLYAKLGCHSRLEVVRLAAQHGFMQLTVAGPTTSRPERPPTSVRHS